MREIVFLFFILFIWNLEAQPTYIPPPEPNSSFPFIDQQSPRFCSLQTNSTCYCCDWTDYSNNLTLRSLGAIIAAGVIFIILLILVCACCWSTSLQDRLQVTQKEGVGASCYPWVKFIFMGIPFLTLIVGVICLGIAFSYWNGIVIEAPKQLTTVRDNILNYEPVLHDIVYNQMPTTNGRQFNKQLIDNGFMDTKKNMEEFIGVLKSVDIARNVLIWIAVISAILSTILSCIYVQFNKGTLFEYLCFCFFLILLAVCLLIPYANVMTYTAEDCCNELSYKEGVLNLWQERYRANVVYLGSITDLLISEHGNQSCNYIDQICQLQAPTQPICDPCNPNNVIWFENKRFLDGINMVTLASCSLTCIDVNLKNLSSYAMRSLNYTNYFINLNPLMEYPLTLLDDIDLRNYLMERTCDISDPVGLTYTGCGILLCGMIICLVLCLILRGHGTHHNDPISTEKS